MRIRVSSSGRIFRFGDISDEAIDRAYTEAKGGCKERYDPGTKELRSCEGIVEITASRVFELRPPRDHEDARLRAGEAGSTCWDPVILEEFDVDAAACRDGFRLIRRAIEKEAAR